MIKSIQHAVYTVSKFYGDKKAERSHVPLINHIIEGIRILEYLHARSGTIAAYAIHPITQGHNTEDWMLDSEIPAHVWELSHAYANAANSYLLPKYIAGEPIRLFLTVDLQQMLIADKVQNYDDFMIHHHGSHAKSDELEKYFQAWFDFLGLTAHHVETLRKVGKGTVELDMKKASQVVSVEEQDPMGKRTVADIFETIRSGNFYSDYDQSMEDIGVLRKIMAHPNPADYRYWEGRYRDEKADNHRMITVLEDIANGLGMEGVDPNIDLEWAMRQAGNAIKKPS